MTFSASNCRCAAALGLLSLLCVGFYVRTTAEAAEISGERANAGKLEPYDSPTNGLGSWIWAEETFDRQTCQLWRTFEIPASNAVAHARLLMTVDNEFTLFLDGHEVGRGADWRELFDYNLTPLLSPGRHVLAVKAFNSSSYAGMLLGLRVVLADGRVIEVKSDDTWRIVPEGFRGWDKVTEAQTSWPAAKEVAGFGAVPYWKTPESAADGRAGQTETNQATSGANYVSPTNGLGSWIWAEETFDRQTCQLWRTFEIPASNTVTHARLLMTVDNVYTLFFDGREVGRGAEWRHLYEHDLTLLLTPGKHVLAVKAFNSDAQAGMLLGLRVELADGRVLAVKSDTSWRIVPNGTRGWEKKTEPATTWPAATLMAPLGGLPWWVTPEAIEILPAMQPIRLYFWQTGWFQITLLSVCGVVILISLRLMAQVALHRKEQWALQGERARIARDIHDDIGARMTQLVLHGEVAQSELPADSKTRQHLDGICQEARGLLSTMDEILWAVNPRRDTLRDFSSYVCNYAQTFLSPTSIQCLFEVDPEMSAVALALPLRRSLLMAIKETLNNAVKYSQATELRLKIQWQGKCLVVVVQDNGRGFDPATTRPGRNGLNNMMQRMRELGGSCRVTSKPGQGCRVEFEIPLTRPRDYTIARIWRSRPQGHEAQQTQESTKD